MRRAAIVTALLVLLAACGGVNEKTVVREVTVVVTVTATAAPAEAPRATDTPVPPPPAPPPPASAPRACCRVCTTRKACGNSCINRQLTCRQGPGCACNAREIDRADYPALVAAVGIADEGILIELGEPDGLTIEHE